MVQWNEQKEKITFVAFGKENAKKDSLIVEEGKTIEGLVLSIKESQLYKRVYQLQVKGVEGAVVITGKTALNDQMGYGDKALPYTVQVGDLVRITYLGMYKTGKGKDAYKFKVEVGSK